MMSTKLFKTQNTIKIYIKGHKHAHGYIIKLDGKPVNEGIDKNDFNQNVSEFLALNEAIKTCRNQFPSINTIDVYTNLELIRNVVNNPESANDLRDQLNNFLNQTTGMSIKILWIKSSNKESSKISDVTGNEEDEARSSIEALTDKIDRFKRQSGYRK